MDVKNLVAEKGEILQRIEGVQHYEAAKIDVIPHSRPGTFQRGE